VSSYSPGKLSVTGKTGGRVVALSHKADALFTRLVAGRNNQNGFLLRGRFADGWGENHHIEPVRRAALAAGLPKETTLYVARHSYITQHLTKGVPPSAVAKQTGTSVAMLERNYTHFMTNDLTHWFGGS